jgi:uncharacterized protein YabE (DUF348 family)
MIKLARRPAKRYGILIALFSLFCVGAGVITVTTKANAESTLPQAGQHLVTIHDGGVERGILTEAGTLRQAFEEASILIDPNDIVEPGLDETLVASSYDVNVYRARPVTVVDGGVRTKVMSPYQTAKQIAEHAGIVLYDEDETSLAVNTDMVSEGAGVQLKITRATEFTFVLYGKRILAHTMAKTAGEMLEQKKIQLGANDTLSVAKDQAMIPGMTIELWRNGKQTVSEEKDVAFEVEKVKDMDRDVGYREIKTPGELGKRTVTYEIEMRDGKEVGRAEIQSILTKEPKKQVEIVGGKMKNTFNGSFGEALARLRSCEAGGVYSRNSGNGYYGAYQYNISTWADYGGYHIPSDAPPAVQDERAWLTYQKRGWQPWPSCTTKMGLQDIYR